MSNTHGAIEINWTDGTKGYVILPIHEYRNDGPRFRLNDGAQRGTHILSAGDVRGSYNVWVSDLLRDDQIVDTLPAGMEVY